MSETFLQVEFRENDEGKRLGAYWNRKRQQCYVPADRDLTSFACWLPDLMRSINKIANFAGRDCISAIPTVFNLIDIRPVLSYRNFITTQNVRRSVTAVACICILDLACERKSESSPKAWLIGENKVRQAVRE